MKKLDLRVDTFANSNIEARETMAIVQTEEQSMSMDNEAASQMLNQQHGSQMSFMTIDKVKERIVQWFKSEAGYDEEDNKQNQDFVAQQFASELNQNGMLSVQYKLIQEGQPINLQQLFKQIMMLS